MIAKLLPYVSAFAGSLVATLLLTPLVREASRRLGMVDKPDPRRINKVPIPRAGGMAIMFGLMISYGIFLGVTGLPGLFGVSDAVFYKLAALSVGVALLGLADDRFSLAPKVKLAGQLVFAFLVWSWAGLGFCDLWPSLPAWIDCLLTVFWIVGAINAFNLIDGLDGLASGIALIATVGMAGGLFFVRDPASTLFYFAFAGALLGFLRYNYNPASVFLGDSGSMFIGFVVATMPLVSHVPNSFLVSVGVPLLAMGVPIFDTTLAIVRRTLRRLLSHGEAAAGQVMTADADHLHHRLLRRAGLNQRKAAWMLYAIAAGLVAVGLIAMTLESHAGGFWLASVAIASVVFFKDAKIEFFDAGRLLSSVAHSSDRITRRRKARFATPFLVVADMIILCAAFLVCAKAMNLPLAEHDFRSFLPIRVASVFFLLAFFRGYRTVWARALVSNYMRLFVACAFGSVLASAVIYYWPTTSQMTEDLAAMTLLYALVSFVLLLMVRVLRSVVRDFFYALDCSRLGDRPDVSRILVYGAGLRYVAFRRELVRTTDANDRMIVGILDDDVFLKGKYIGGIRICGTINDAPKVIERLGVDAVVIACEISDEWLSVVKSILAPTGVRVSHFSLSETPVS